MREVRSKSQYSHNLHEYHQKNLLDGIRFGITNWISVTPIPMLEMYFEFLANKYYPNILEYVFLGIISHEVEESEQDMDTPWKGR